jgi:hypothetical protein
VRFDILVRRNARPRWRIYRGGAPRVIHKAYHMPNTISDICSSLDRSAVSHTPPPVLLPTLEWNSAIQCLRMSWWDSRSIISLSVGMGHQVV